MSRDETLLGSLLFAAERNQVLLDKTIMKLKARIATYNQIFSSTGKNVASLKSVASKTQDELSFKVHSFCCCVLRICIDI